MNSEKKKKPLCLADFPRVLCANHRQGDGDKCGKNPAQLKCVFTFLLRWHFMYRNLIQGGNSSFQTLATLWKKRCYCICVFFFFPRALRSN